MFAYVLIAFELMVLYLVYYYIYIWKPKSIHVNNDIWGIYENHDSSTIDPQLALVFSDKIRDGFRAIHGSVKTVEQRKAG